jgi:hypothetical protein
MFTVPYPDFAAGRSVRLPSACGRILGGMKAWRAARFYFTGAVILPGFIWFAGDPSFAVQMFVFLLLAGAVCSVAAFQASDRKPPQDH